MLADPPATLAAPCAQAAELPAGAMSAGAIERTWARDRAALAECRLKHRALNEFVSNIRGVAGR